MAKMNYTRVNKDNLIRNRGYEFADGVAPPKDNYVDVPVTLGGNTKKDPPKCTVVRRKRSDIIRRSEGLSDSRLHKISMLDEKIEKIAKKILLTNRCQKVTCHSLYIQLIAGIKKMVVMDPLKKETPLSNTIIAAIEKISKL